MAKLDITTLATNRDHAAAWISTKSAQAKKDIHAQVVAKSKTSKRVKWVNLAKAMAEGDNLAKPNRKRGRRSRPRTHPRLHLRSRRPKPRPRQSRRLTRRQTSTRLRSNSRAWTRPHKRRS